MKKTLKIYCNIDFDSRNFEGRTSAATSLVRGLEQRGYIFTMNPTDADILHFHSSGIADSRKAYRLQQQFRRPCIYSLYSTATTEPFMHGVNWFIQRCYFQKTATNFLLSYSAVLPLRWRSYYLKKLKAVVVPCSFLQQELSSNTRVIYLGVDAAKFAPPAPIKKNNKILKIGYFGHPGVFKGMNDFVQASKNFPPAEVHLFLTQQFPRVDAYILKHNPQSIIHGYTSDIVRAYNEMDIIVLPYRTQIGTVANPLVLLEAMACGRAIVTTNFKFIIEIAQDAALVVPPYSPKALTEAVHLLANDPHLRQRLGEKARKQVLFYYTQKQMIDQYDRLYQELAQESIP